MFMFFPIKLYRFENRLRFVNSLKIYSLNVGKLIVIGINLKICNNENH